MIGGGEQGKKLRILIKNLRLKKVVKLLGYKSRKETAELLSLSDVFVRPSRQEGFGIAFLEAMATGLPIIGTAVGGIGEIVTHRHEGLLIDPNNLNQLVRALQRLRNDLRLRTKLGQLGRKKVKKKYLWAAICRQVEALYSQIAAK